jgi:hypothetical protein
MAYREIELNKDITLHYLKENFDIYKDFLNIIRYFYDSIFSSNLICRTYWSDDYDFSIKNCLHGYLKDSVLIKQARMWGINEIYNFIHSDTHKFCLFPDLMFHAGSTELESSDKYITIGNKDHCYLIDSSLSLRQIETVTKFGSDCHFCVGFLVKCEEEIECKNVSINLLDNFILKKVIIGAYDEEGFIIIDIK